jgi:hypothetical protein
MGDQIEIWVRVDCTFGGDSGRPPFGYDLCRI